MTPPPLSSGRSEPILRIAPILDERRKAEGSYSKLAEAITAADRKVEGRRTVAAKDVIDRRKLKNIVNQEQNEKLSFRQLIALDRYLEPRARRVAAEYAAGRWFPCPPPP